MFIEVTLKANDKKIFINLNKINEVCVYGDKTQIFISHDDYYVVKEAYEDVKALIEEATKNKCNCRSTY